LWFAVVVIEMCNMFFRFLEAAIYADNGVGDRIMLAFADGTPILVAINFYLNCAVAAVLQVTARVLFVGFLVLVAVGYQLTTNKIHTKAMVVFGFCLWSFPTAFFSLLEPVREDDASTATTFERTPGIIDLVLRSTH
jgi:hypothetical protein